MLRYLLPITGLIYAKRSVVPILLVGIICGLGNQWLISQEGKKAEVRIEITSVEAKIVKNKDVISFAGKTNLPEGTILDVSLVHFISSLGEPEREGVVISKLFEVDRSRYFFGELSDFIVPLPPGIYQVRVGISRRQRKNIRGFLAQHLPSGRRKITIQKKIILGNLSKLIEIEKVKSKELSEMLGFFKPAYQQLAQWVKLYNAKRLRGRQKELNKWFQDFRRRLGEILTETTRFGDNKVPSIYKTSYKKVKGIALRLRDEGDYLIYSKGDAAVSVLPSNDPAPEQVADLKLPEDILADIEKAWQTFQTDTIFNLFLMLEYREKSLLITYGKVKADSRCKALWREFKPEWSRGLSRFKSHFREIQKKFPAKEPVWVKAVKKLTQLLAKQLATCTDIIQEGETKKLTKQLTKTRERIKSVLDNMKAKLSLFRRGRGKR